MPSPVGVRGLAPRKKSIFALKLGNSEKVFGTSFLYYSIKWGDYPPVLKVGDLSPLSPPCSDAYVYVGAYLCRSVAMYVSTIK